MSDLEKFREETRAWLEANCPPSMRTPPSGGETVWGGKKERFPNEDARLWLERMGQRGWTAPTWPKEYGGGGLSKEENKILQQELRRIKARKALTSFGIMMLGPALLEYGTEEQKKEHLPRIVRGEIRWCQGYSEPGAGSDLAGLQTSAVEDGDDFIVNGQKVWTSYGNYADWIFCLVRTDKSVKHDGISFLLIDMETPGVSTRPIKLISGSSPFCETFLENVRVPRTNLVGQKNGGWNVAKLLMQHERSMASEVYGEGSGGKSKGGMPQLAKDYLGEEDGRIADLAFRRKVADHEIKKRAYKLTVQRAADEAKAGGRPGAASSMFKYYGTEHDKRGFELLVEILGTQGLGWEGDEFTSSELGTTRKWLRSKASSIEGGTSEIQLNIISKRVLGLPEVK